MELSTQPSAFPTEAVRFYTAYGLTIGSEIALPPLTETTPAPVDLTIKRQVLPVGSAWQSTKIHRAGLHAQFAQNGPDQLWLNWSPLAVFRATNGNELALDTSHTDEGLLSLFTLSEAIGLILFQKGYFLLHGSAIQLRNKGIVFLGEPGAGKSTTVAAFAQKNVAVLSDDMVCIRLDERGEPWLIPAFPQIKLWEKSVDGLQLAKTDLDPVREGANKFSWHDSVSFGFSPVPLAQIFVLTPPNESRAVIDLLPTSQIPVELLRYFPLADALLQGEPLKSYFEKTVAIARTTPVCRMPRPANFTALYEFVAQLTIDTPA